MPGHCPIPASPSVCTPVHVHAMELEQTLECHGEQVCTQGEAELGSLCHTVPTPMGAAALCTPVGGLQVCSGLPGPSIRGSSSSQSFPPPANHCEESGELIRDHSNLPSEPGEASVPREMGVGYADRYKASPSVYLTEKRKDNRRIKGNRRII